jgi:6-phosphogluconolactonase (cycloisomerase 2 family)
MARQNERAVVGEGVLSQVEEGPDQLPMQVSACAGFSRAQLIVISCYTRFDNLAHGPRGTQATRSLYTFQMDPTDGQMLLLSVTKDPVMNPAFSRFHPTKNVLYTCTESVAENGVIDAWSVEPKGGGRLTKLSSVSAQGTSTCYLTLDKDCENMLVVNYWNATIGVFGIDGQTGAVTGLRSMYDPNAGRPMKARHDSHVNHSVNDETAQKERQADPHSHAVILDPFFGKIAYVPDLGMDLIRQFKYDGASLTAVGTMPSGPEGRRFLGPRYIEFHPSLPCCYVVNELSSEVSVFDFDWRAADAIINGAEEEEANTAEPTLRLKQTVRTIPDGWPTDMNTCGRICVHPAGNFVLVSNRGHDSISVFRVHHEPLNPGMLSLVDVQHTRGATPRHFQFDGSGQWLITANQDSDSIGVFRFNLATGKLDWTGNEYRVPSPNFVCSVRPHVYPSMAKERAVPWRRSRRPATASRL